jgi:hypothetical protein
MSKKRNNAPILALFPNGRGLGYAVMEGALSLLDSEVLSIQPMCNSKILNRVKNLIDYYEPTLVILEDHQHSSSRKGKRVENVIQEIEKLVTTRGGHIKKYSRADIRFVFSNFNAYTKYEISKVIADNIPVLKPKLTPPRKTYESEKFTVGLFDAVALGITHYYKEE